jgi:hypothetical protein
MTAAPRGLAGSSKCAQPWQDSTPRTADAPATPQKRRPGTQQRQEPGGAAPAESPSKKPCRPSSRATEDGQAPSVPATPAPRKSRRGLAPEEESQPPRTAALQLRPWAAKGSAESPAARQLRPRAQPAAPATPAAAPDRAAGLAACRGSTAKAKKGGGRVLLRECVVDGERFRCGDSAYALLEGSAWQVKGRCMCMRCLFSRPDTAMCLLRLNAPCFALPACGSCLWEVG